MLEIHLRIIYQQPIGQVTRSMRNHTEKQAGYGLPEFKTR